MGALKLYTYPGNKNAFKALIAAQYVGAKIECPAFQFGVDNKTPEFLKKNPHGKVPVLETDHGCVFESNAIARYVARLADVGLFGSTTIDLGKVEQWIDFSTNEIDAPMCSWLYPLLGFWPYDAKKEKAAQEAVKKALTALNTYLESRTYLVGDHVTLADIICVCNLFPGFTKVYDKAFRSAFPNVERYFMTCAHKPQFAAVLGEVKLCETPLAPPKEDKKAAAKEEKKPKEEKPKAQPKPAAAVAAPKEAPAAEEEKPKEKPKDWTAELPPTPMQMDSWKRLYSNSPASNFREVCIKRLWEGGPVPNSPSNEEFVGYDPQGYSWWFFDYKYPEENTVNYIVMNKVGGFLQRVDYARKYAFGVMAILKKGDLFPIKGVWMFRGQDIPQQLIDECYDLEFYTIRKADLGNAADKKMIEDIICEEGTIDGMECVDCKVFK